MTTKRVADLAPGDRLDLEDDPIANGPCSVEQATGEPCDYRDKDGKSITWQYEYGQVDSVEPEGEGCLVVTFTNTEAIGFPPDHLVTLG